MSTIKTDAIISVSVNGNLDLSANGTGGVKVSDYLIQTKGSDIASATALTLGKDGNLFDVTGTTTITSIGTQGIGSFVTLHFDSALTFTHHATDLILPGAANITTATGDIAVMYEYASADWRCVSYTKASGTAVVAPATASTTVSGLSELATTAETTTGTDTGRVITPAGLHGALAGLTDATITASDTIIFADVGSSNALKEDTVQGILDLGSDGIAAETVYNAGTKSSGTYTLDVANGGMQRFVNGGAFTLAPQTTDCEMIIHQTNNSSAGAITVTGYDKVGGDLNNSDEATYLLHSTVINSERFLDVDSINLGLVSWGTTAVHDQVITTNNQATYTYSSASLGTSTSDRVLIIVVDINGWTAGCTMIGGSVTVGGVATSLQIQQLSVGGNTEQGVSIWTYALGTGITSGDVIVTTGGGTTMNEARVLIYDAKGMNATATATASDSDNATANALTATVTIPAKGGAIAIRRGGNSTTSTWSSNGGMSENLDSVSEGAFYTSVASSFPASTQTDAVITVTPSGTSGPNILVVAAFEGA